MNDLNKTQYATLLKFKEKLLRERLVEDFSQYDDAYLLRFLRARKFILEKSFLMISDFFKWRKDQKVDEIEDFRYEVLLEAKKLYKHGYHKTDKLVTYIV